MRVPQQLCVYFVAVAAMSAVKILSEESHEVYFFSSFLFCPSYVIHQTLVDDFKGRFPFFKYNTRSFDYLF